MSHLDKLLEKVLLGMSDANIAFSDICRLLRHLGFEERIRGSHHIFSKDHIPEIINIQPMGRNAKPYQVRQIRNLILRYKFGGLK
jgi:predicted RNA binding protein YcfA (HicA-like mRNA interferase family)